MGSVEDIQKMFGRLQREAENIVDSMIELVYFMRGAVTYEEMLRRTHGERKRFDRFIEKRLEKEAKHPYPNY